MVEEKTDSGEFGNELMLQREKLSVCIITKNEEATLLSCLESITDIADEIIVLDSGSKDRTIEIARSLGAIVHEHPFDDFSSQKTRAVQLSTFPWILILDADERVSKDLATEIKVFLSTQVETAVIHGLYINRLNFFLGTPIYHSGWSPDWLLRLYRKDSGGFDGSPVHESIVVQGKTKRLKGYLFHETHPTIEIFVLKNLRYASLWANSQTGTKKKASVFNLFSHPMGMFFKMYILRLGFLDGFAGMILAILYSYHVFIKYLMILDKNKGISRRSGGIQ